jgi:hypothetical protein
VHVHHAHRLHESKRRWTRCRRGHGQVRAHGVAIGGGAEPGGVGGGYVRVSSRGRPAHHIRNDDRAVRRRACAPLERGRVGLRRRHLASRGFNQVVPIPQRSAVPAIRSGVCVSSICRFWPRPSA